MAPQNSQLRTHNSPIRYGGVPWLVKHPKGSCRCCGCTEDRACPGGCYWMIEGVLCDRCWRRAVDLVENTPAGFKTFEAWLILETNPNVLVLALFNAADRDRQDAIYRRLEEVVIGPF